MFERTDTEDDSFSARLRDNFPSARASQDDLYALELSILSLRDQELAGSRSRQLSFASRTASPQRQSSFEAGTEARPGRWHKKSNNDLYGGRGIAEVVEGAEDEELTESGTPSRIETPGLRTRRRQLQHDQEVERSPMPIPFQRQTTALARALSRGFKNTLSVGVTDPPNPEDGVTVELSPEPTSQDPLTRKRTRSMLRSLSNFRTSFRFLSKAVTKNKEDYQSLSQMVNNHVSFRKLNLRRSHTSFNSYFQFLLYRELLVYCGFICLYLYIIFAIIPITLSFESSSYFGAQDAMMNVASASSSAGTFEGMNTYDDFWTYLSTYVIPLADEDTFEHYHEQVGNIRLRQIRIKSSPCLDVHMKPSTCYPAFTYDNIETDPLQGLQTGTTYYHASSDYPYPPLYASWSFIRDYGYRSTYGNGGYVFDFSRNITEAQAQVTALSADEWLNVSTRAVTINVFYYNKHSEIFVVSDLLVEVSITGLLIMTPRIYPVRLMSQNQVIGLTICLIILSILSMYFNIVGNVLNLGIKMFLRRPLSYFEILSTISFVLQISFIFVYNHACNLVRLALESPQSHTTHIPLLYLAIQSVKIRELAGFNVLMFSFRLFQYFFLNRRLTLVWATLRHAALDLSYFIGIFLILFVGYGLMAYIIFGSDIDDFHSFSASFWNLFAFIAGNFDSDAMNQASPVVGAIFFFSFIVLVMLILMNVFIAILSENYELACHELKKSEREEKHSEERGYNWNWFKKLFTLKLHITPDEDGGRHIHTDDIVKIWLKRYPKVDFRTTSSPFEITCEATLVAQSDQVYLDFLAAHVVTGDSLHVIAMHAKKSNKRVRLHVNKVWVSMTGVFLECTVTRGGEVLPWQELRLSYTTTLRFFLRAFIWPNRARLHRFYEYCKHYDVTTPRVPLDLKNTRDLISQLIAQKEVYDSKVDKGKASKPRSLKLDSSNILTEVMRLESNFPDLDPSRIMAFINEASKLDGILTNLRLHGGVTGIVNRYLVDGVNHGNPSVPPENLFLVFHDALERVRSLERQLNEIYVSRSGFAPPPQSLRFDQLLYEVRLRQTRPITALEMKKHALKIWFSFPLHCFDLISEDVERDTYVPRPVDLTCVKRSALDPVLTMGELVHVMAEVSHDSWCLDKVTNGWRYGPVRDDAMKQHPLLIPYHSLTRADKAYDIDSCTENLRLMVYLGYDIVRPVDGCSSRLVPVEGQHKFQSQLREGYVLRHVDSSSVQVGQELYELAELLARNAHEIWADKRRKAGWTWGPDTNEALKVHNLLQPFEMLDQRAQESNLSSCLQTIRTVLALGCKIRLSSHIFGPSRRF